MWSEVFLCCESNFYIIKDTFHISLNSRYWLITGQDLHLHQRVREVLQSWQSCTVSLQEVPQCYAATKLGLAILTMWCAPCFPTFLQKMMPRQPILLTSRWQCTSVLMWLNKGLISCHELWAQWSEFSDIKVKCLLINVTK